MNTFTAPELALLTEKQKPTIKLLEELQEGLVALNKAWDEEIQNALSAGILKPTKKVIDLSVLIDSQIDCEFKYGGSLTPKSWFIDKLTEIHNEANTYKPSLQGYTTYCRPRMNHKHAWDGGNCPLPEGFVVEVWWRDGSDDVRTINRGNGLYWGHNNHASDIIHFKVLRVADGYVMPGESE
ncbi:MAG: hypothetical protein ACI9RI_000874 [Oceanospirillaceae bacterium]|jgi:hypothetical protein